MPWWFAFHHTRYETNPRSLVLFILADFFCPREAASLLKLNLKNLDASSQEIIRLKFTENLSYKQISVRTGLTVSNVGYLLHHSIKSLAADLARAGLLP